MMWEHLDNRRGTPTAGTLRVYHDTMPEHARMAPDRTPAAAHIGRPRSSPPHRNKMLRTPACAARREAIPRPKKHPQSPRDRRDRVVAASKNDAVQERGRGEHLEVDLLLLTCAQGWENGHGCMLGKHGDEPGVLGLAIHAYA